MMKDDQVDALICFVLLASFFLIALWPFIARGQEHNHDDAAGKFYQTWMMPNGNPNLPRSGMCCNKKDCYQTAVKKSGNTWYAQRREDGQWIPIPEHRLEHNQPDARESPDGHNHVCMPPPQNGMSVFCAVLGSDT